MRATEFTETVNDKLFWTGYEKKKEILDGAYVLVASAGYVGYGAKPDHKSTQFRIVARTAKGGDVGWVNFENKDDHLEALDLTIQPAHRRKGIATEMYRFARELGNDIAPSKLQTGMGKQFWNKDHSVDEALIGTLNLSAVEILVDDHALNRAVERDVSPLVVDKVLKMLPSHKDKISAITPGEKFWVYSSDLEISVGMRRLDDRKGLHRYMLVTVLRSEPWSSRLPVITI